MPSCIYSDLLKPSALERRLEAVEPWLKYRPRVGVRKDRKMIWAPLFSCQQRDTCGDVETRAAANLLERRKGQPQEEDELEDEVEGEPVDDVDEALQDGKLSKDNPVLRRRNISLAGGRVAAEDWGRKPYSQPLGVVGGAGSEQGVQRVVGGNDKPSKVGEQLAAEVEDDEEEVESGEADDGVGLGDTGLLLKVVEGGVLGELWEAIR